MNQINEIKTKIYQIIAEHSGAGSEEIRPDAHFADDLNIGELELAEIIATVKKRFQIEPSPESSKGIKTVGDLINLVFDEMDGILDDAELEAALEREGI